MEPICGRCCSSSAVEAPSQPHEFAWRRRPAAAAGWFCGAPGVLWGTGHHAHLYGALPSGSVGLRASYGAQASCSPQWGSSERLYGHHAPSSPQWVSWHLMATLPSASLPVFELLHHQCPEQTHGAIGCMGLELSAAAVRSHISPAGETAASWGSICAGPMSSTRPTAAL